MFVVYSGKRGTGKTYHAICDIKKALEQGKKVYVNFHVDFRKLFPDLPHENCLYFENLDDLAYMRDCLMIFDEAHSDLSSWDWQSMPKRQREYLALSRHIHVDIIFISQDIKRLNTVARELTEGVIEHHVFGGRYNDKKKQYSKTWFFWTSEFMPKEIDNVKRFSLANSFIRFDKNIASCYDTDELFGELLKQLPPKIFAPSYEPNKL